jgi:ubiquitin-conjugating enzyme E2 Z
LSYFLITHVKIDSQQGLKNPQRKKSNMSGGPITKAVQRIMKKDLPSVQNEDMKSNGIYYFMDEKSVMKGTALIIGPGGTPYEGGYWFFSVLFNDNHPFEPPQVLTLTQDGRTRFNPNMYREGKVCLSLLGTWSQGDKWTSVQTLGSVLLSILGMVLTDQPLRNEPCFSGFVTHPTFDPYNRIIFHASTKNLLHYLQYPPVYLPEEYKEEIVGIMKDQFKKNKDELIKRCLALAPTWDGKKEFNEIFKLETTYNFKSIADQLVATNF